VVLTGKIHVCYIIISLCIIILQWAVVPMEEEEEEDEAELYLRIMLKI
jgi:hypothetical protein